MEHGRVVVKLWGDQGSRGAGPGGQAVVPGIDAALRVRSSHCTCTEGNSTTNKVRSSYWSPKGWIAAQRRSQFLTKIL